MKANIDAAITFLTSELSKDFASFSSPQQQAWQPKYEYHTSFVPSIILQALYSVNDARLLATKQALYDHLLKQRSTHWTFNYWTRTAQEAQDFPYPDDLDDTFCALVALHSFQPEAIQGEALAAVVKLLLATETAVGGPYRTWLTTPESTNWQDVDIAVNANIAYFLQSIGSPNPTLTNYLERHITAQQFHSPYYPSSFPVWYYLARVCPPHQQPKLAKHIASATPKTSLETALALTALCQLQPNHRLISTYTQRLLKTQQTDGSWSAAAFCFDPARDGQSYVHGATTLTTALVLEALVRSRRLSTTTVKTSAHETSHREIIAMAKSQIQSLPPNLSRQGLAMLHFMDRADPQHHITLLPYLAGRFYPKQPADLYQQLSLANLYGWMAYTIYDDFLDEEGQLPLLPVANFALRSSWQYFQTVLPEARFQKCVATTFNTIDEANAWEVTHCRWPVKHGQLIPGILPAYGKRAKLAERSLGHGLSPVAIMVASGQSLSSREVQSFRSAFRHYLIARQLDDDAHDWQADIQKGQLNYVVSLILRQLNYRQPIALTQLLPLMQQQFWQHSLLDVCDTMSYHLKTGKQLANNPLISELIAGIEKSVQRTRAKQQQATSFLTHYRPRK